ncbi:MAG: type I methionyl aminopeptidase [Planctomycetota bacterium]|nr:type I methionyl aminopeptidase [Planctomycetota bacterium]MDI6787484.1 type I methionyl aminopeptidase [Planctomycetota bacterium]
MIQCKSSREIELIRKAGEITAGALNLVSAVIKPDISTKLLDETVVKYIKEKGGIPAFKGYRGFPANICASVNEEVVHGIPNKRLLKTGDIVSIDIGVCYKNYYADAAITLPVGNISETAKHLINVTKQALYLAIKKVRANVRLSEISATIQNFVEGNRFSVVRDLVGHGIGSVMHEEPQIPNYVDKETRPNGSSGRANRLDNEVILKEGMVLAIEPMVNEGTYQVETITNGWTVVTKDRKLSAHFEHTVLVKGDGSDILTA